MTIGAIAFPSNNNYPREYVGHVTLYNNSVKIGEYVMTSEGNVVSSDGGTLIGTCSFELPVTGSVKVKLYTKYTIDTGTGIVPEIFGDTRTVFSF